MDSKLNDSCITIRYPSIVDIMSFRPSRVTRLRMSPSTCKQRRKTMHASPVKLQHTAHVWHTYWLTHTHTHTRWMALCPGLPGWAGTRKVTPVWILQKQETVSGSGISWAICKSAPRSRQITMPAPHHSFFYRLDALLAAQPTASKHWRHLLTDLITYITVNDSLHFTDSLGWVTVRAPCYS